MMMVLKLPEKLIVAWLSAVLPFTLMCGQQSPAQTSPDSATGQAAPPAAQPEVLPGPLQQERAALLAKILKAKEQGIGTTAYLAEFNRIQAMPTGGGSCEQVHARIDSLSNSLDEQLQRSKILKTQRLQITSQKDTNASSADSRVSAGTVASIMKEKYGDQVPADMTAEQLMQKINQNPKAKALWEKFQKDKNPAP